MSGGAFASNASAPDARASNAAFRRGGETPAVASANAKASTATATWEQLSAGGLAQLAPNLRAAGFEPRLVHAIVAAMVTESFALRRYALEFGDADTPYWRQAPVFLDQPARIMALAELGAEQDRQMRALLGDDYLLQDDLQVADMKRRFGNLGPEKLIAIQALVADFSPQLTVTRPTAGQPFPPPNVEMPLRLSGETRTQLAALLTPEELREFDLRNDRVAVALRDLPDFNATEAEYRALHDALSGGGVASVNNRGEPVDGPAVKAVLSPDRYLDYQQAIAPGQSTLNRLLARLGRPLSAARQVVAIQNETKQQTDAVAANSSLSNDERTARLKAIDEAAAQRIGSVLGPTGLDIYRRSGGLGLTIPPMSAPSR